MAPAVQIFDSWGSALSFDDFNNLSLYAINIITDRLKAKYKNIPIIIYSSSSHTDQIAKLQIPIGLCWQADMVKVRDELGQNQILQGNFDPTLLFADEKTIASKIDSIINTKKFNSNWIANLGHGILPQTEPHKLKFFIEYVKEKSRKAR